MALRKISPHIRHMATALDVTAAFEQTALWLLVSRMHFVAQSCYNARYAWWQ
jgi:hypothetical protein